MMLGSYMEDASIKIAHNGRTYTLPSIMLDCGRYNVMNILANGVSCIPMYVQVGEGGYGLKDSTEVRPNLPTAADMQLEFPVAHNNVTIEKINSKLIKCVAELASVESFFLSEMILLDQEKRPFAKAAFKQAIPIQNNTLIEVEWLIGL